MNEERARMHEKVVVVTGGSRGIGKELVEAFAAAGAHVVIASRKLDPCVTLANEIQERHGCRALPVACNVSDWSSCDALVEAAYTEFGRVDVLINNAGMSPIYPSIDQVTEALFDKVIGTNLKGAFRLSAAIGTRMAESNGGSIINISSIASIRPDATAVPYAAAKAGLNAMTQGMAQALGPAVRVNAILCGPFRTDIADAWTPGVEEFFQSNTALRRVGIPNEVVGAAMFFAGDASSFATGALLRLDGGFR